jgi:hypothetical protein
MSAFGEVLEKANKKQIRIAETEKYPHVTFFFSGGREEPFVGEKRILKNSPKVATYDLQPEMSAFELKDALVSELKKGEVDFVVFNGTKKCFIQVAYLLATDEVIEREFGAFKPIKDQSPKFVLSMDKFDFTRDGITHINIIDFLLFKKDIFFI